VPSSDTDDFIPWLVRLHIINEKDRLFEAVFSKELKSIKP